MTLGLKRLLGGALDVAICGVLLAVRWAAGVREVPDASLEMAADLPSWWWRFGSIHDWILVGPDAGNWAANAQAWVEGGTLDPHRLPAYTVATAWMSGIFEDVVVAGHMVNHCVSALNCLLAYILVRWVAGRGVALAVGLLCAYSPELVNNQLFYGVDPLLQTMPLLLAGAAWHGMKGRAWAVVAVGAASGVALGTHFFALFFPPVALGLLLFSSTGWPRRAGALLLGCVVTAVTWKVMLWRYDGVDLGFVVSIYTAGVGGTPDLGAVESHGMADSMGLVISRIGSAPGLAIQRGLRSLKVGGMPWLLLVGLFWLGVAGPGVRGHGETKWNWRSGFLLVAFLLPLVPLEAARAPDRYALYSRPFFFALVFRGAMSVGSLLHAGVWRKTGRALGPAWSWGLVPVAVLLAGYPQAYQARWNLRPPLEEGLHAREAAHELRVGFPDARSVVTTSQSIPFHAGLAACPRSPCSQGGKQALRGCLSVISRECKGAGPIPYLLRRDRTAGVGDAANPDLDTWVQANGSQVTVLRTQQGGLEIWSLDRQVLATALAGNPGSPVESP